MDGISDDSPLIPVIMLWDRVGSLLEEYPHFLFTLCCTLTYFAFLGNLKNGALILAIFSWMRRSQLRLTLGTLVDGKTICIALCSIGMAWILLHYLSWVLFEGSETHTRFSRP